MSKPIGPGVQRANTVRVWHAGQSGRRIVMMLSPSHSGGSVTELSSHRELPRARRSGQHATLSIPKLVNIAHPRKVNDSQRASNCLTTLPGECHPNRRSAPRRWNPSCSCSVSIGRAPPNQSSRPMPKIRVSIPELQRRALSEVRMQPGCHSVQEIAINRVAKRAENNWSLCVLAAGAADANTAARAAIHVQTVLRRDYDLLTD